MPVKSGAAIFAVIRRHCLGTGRLRVLFQLPVCLLGADEVVSVGIGYMRWKALSMIPAISA